MRSRWWYLLGLAVIPLSLAFSTHVANADTHTQIHFDDVGRVVTLTIPTPPCRPDHKTVACTWELFVNEPDVPGQTVVGEVYGTSGVLSVHYPAFCGVIQADAIVGPPPRLEVGHRDLINNCSCPSSIPQVALTSVVTRPPTVGTADPDQLALFLGLAVVAGALGRRRRV